MEFEPQKPLFCEVCGVDLLTASINHMHCANCWDKEPSSMLGHYTIEGFTCEKVDRPEPLCNQCGKKYAEHAECCAECPGRECECNGTD